MAIIHFAICTRNVWKLNSTLAYINILQPVYFNVFLHSNFLQCCSYVIEFGHESKIIHNNVHNSKIDGKD